MFVCQHSDVRLTSPPVLMLWGTQGYRLDGWKGAFFQVQGPVQGPREEVQGPCARATIPINRNGCKGHLDMCKGHKKRCKGLWCVQGPHLLSLYQNTDDKQYNLVQGPLMCARASSFAYLPIYTKDCQYDLVQGPQWEVQGPQSVVQGPQWVVQGPLMCARAS